MNNGYIFIENSGAYTFYLKLDDGSNLWVNGELVINNSGLHAMRERAAMLELGAGIIMSDWNTLNEQAGQDRFCLTAAILLKSR
jgi:hypothetical protein